MNKDETSLCAFQHWPGALWTTAGYCVQKRKYVLVLKLKSDKSVFQLGFYHNILIHFVWSWSWSAGITLSCQVRQRCTTEEPVEPWAWSPMCHRCHACPLLTQPEGGAPQYPPQSASQILYS